MRSDQPYRQTDWEVTLDQDAVPDKPVTFTSSVDDVSQQMEKGVVDSIRNLYLQGTAGGRRLTTQDEHSSITLRLDTSLPIEENMKKFKTLIDSPDKKQLYGLLYSLVVIVHRIDTTPADDQLGEAAAALMANAIDLLRIGGEIE